MSPLENIDLAHRRIGTIPIEGIREIAHNKTTWEESLDTRLKEKFGINPDELFNPGEEYSTQPERRFLMKCIILARLEGHTFPAIASILPKGVFESLGDDHLKHLFHLHASDAVKKKLGFTSQNSIRKEAFEEDPDILHLCYLIEKVSAEIIPGTPLTQEKIFKKLPQFGTEMVRGANTPVTLERALTYVLLRLQGRNLSEALSDLREKGMPTKKRAIGNLKNEYLSEDCKAAISAAREKQERHFSRAGSADGFDRKPYKRWKGKKGKAGTIKTPRPEVEKIPKPKNVRPVFTHRVKEKAEEIITPRVESPELLKARADLDRTRAALESLGKLSEGAMSDLDVTRLRQRLQKEIVRLEEKVSRG